MFFKRQLAAKLVANNNKTEGYSSNKQKKESARLSFSWLLLFDFIAFFVVIVFILLFSHTLFLKKIFFFFSSYCSFVRLFFYYLQPIRQKKNKLVHNGFYNLCTDFNGACQNVSWVLLLILTIYSLVYYCVTRWF